MMLISFSSFSQTDIPVVLVNNDTVKIHREVAKKVVKDLMYLDVLKQERVLLLENIDTLVIQKSYKDTIIKKKDEQIVYYKKIVDIYKEKEDVYSTAISNLNKDLKVQKLTKKISFGVILLSLGIAFIK